ncbi:hypothetical protein ACG7TL_001846 [Trametes sanguinea]
MARVARTAFHGEQRFGKNLFFPSNNMALLRVLEINASEEFESNDQIPKPLWQPGLAKGFPYQTYGASPSLSLV